MAKRRICDFQYLSDIFKRASKDVGVEFTDEQIKDFLLRFCSYLGNFFYHNPKVKVNLPPISFKGNPNTTTRLFEVWLEKGYNIVQENGLFNPNLLEKWVTGEMQQQKNIQNILNGYVEDILDYSIEKQLEEEISLDSIKKQIEEKKEGKCNGI